jgi:hypothetical protein
MFIAALFIIAKLWKQPRSPTTDQWIKEMWYLYTMEFYSATKKSEIFSFTHKWTELENVVLSEVSRLRRLKATCSPHMKIIDLKNAAILWDTGHTKGRPCTGGIG